MNCSSRQGRSGRFAVVSIGLFISFVCPHSWAFVTTDTAFGTNGRGFFLTNFGSPNDFGISVTVGVGDRLYQLGAQCAGSACGVGSLSGITNYVVSRNAKNGMFDAGFAVYIAPSSIPISGPMVVFDVDDGPASWIYLASESCGPNCRIQLTRVNYSGQVDGAYGVGGKVTITGTNNVYPSGLLVQPDGKLLLSGIDYQQGVIDSIFVTRLNEDGSADAVFGVNGIVSFSFGESDSGNIGLSLDRYTNKIYVTGDTATGCCGGTTPAIARLTPSGALDSTFGTDGMVVNDFEPSGRFIATKGKTAVYANGQADGEVVVVTLIPNSGDNGPGAIGPCPQFFAPIMLSNDGTPGPNYPSAESYCPPFYIGDGGTTNQSDGKFVFNGVYFYQDGTSDEGMTRISGSTEFVQPVRTFPGQGPTPDPFTFTEQTGVPISTPVISNSISVSGISSPSAITVSRASYSINGGAFTSSVGTVNNGDTVRLQIMSAASGNTTVTSTLTVGGAYSSFSVTTNYVPPSSGSGGAIGWTMLLLGIPALLCRRKLRLLNVRLVATNQ